jgi:2-phosphosulfolactate phosphatase
MQRIDVAMTPGEALLQPTADCYVVIDALRATSTMTVMFHRGLRRLLVVETLEQALAERTDPEMLLIGEQGGRRPVGFDYGNSPAEAATLDLAGREAVHVTSNGTKALCAVASRGVTVAGALVNLSAVAQFCARYENVTMVCAGNGGAVRFSLEDFAVAAAFVQRLLEMHPGAALGDAALLAAETGGPERLIARGDHAEIVRRLGLEDDVRFVTKQDVAPAVPLVTEFRDGWCALECAR